ncbi:MAG TPA: hypothetical protein VH438_09155 [Gemmatimonadales bacterium]|jgi:hypothetical protein
MTDRSHCAVLLFVLLFTGGQIASAQVPDSALSAVHALNARLDTLEAGLCPAGPAVRLPAHPTGEPAADSLATALDRLNQRVEKLVAQRCLGAAPDTAGDDLAALRAAADSAAGRPVGAPVDTAAAGRTEFVGRQRSGSALNPEISATGDIRLVGQDGSEHFDAQAREFEVGLQSTLDPYSTAKVFLTFENEEVGVEEGYLYWTGLPGRIRADVGLYRQQVGDLNRWHLHALPESEYPLVYRRFFGDDGLSGVGLSLYTTLPVSLVHGTHEIWAQATSVESDPLFGTDRHTTLLGRLQNFWQLSRSTYGQIGFTALGGDNSDSALTSRVLGLDARLTWRPPNAGTRQDLTLRAEGYQFHSKEAGLAQTRYGAFVDAAFRVSQRWILGARYDYVETPRGPDTNEWGITPAITWWESEFVYLRLEGQHHHDSVNGTDNRVLLQAVFAMGPHKHETY